MNITSVTPDIKNLLFDLGGVIYDINRLDAVKALKEIGMRNPEELLGDYGQKGPFLLIEKGEITPDEFHLLMKPYFDRPVTDQQIDDAFCKFLTGIPVERLQAITHLRDMGYRTYLLSNTNAVMWDHTILREFTKEGYDINHYFDGIITSFEVKAYKPDRQIYLAAIEKLGINPTETIFFDDSQANLDGAAPLGFKTFHVTAQNGFMTLLNSKG